MKSLDKKKIKELEWDRFVKENHTNFSKDANGIKYEFYEDDLLEFITQQRTEILEEIIEKKTDSANCFCDVVTVTDISNLLNKKDE